MDLALKAELMRSYRVLFEANEPYGTCFLFSLHPSKIKKAFRKKALLTHPDRFAGSDSSVQKRNTDLFIEAKSAYENLMKFCEERGKQRVFPPFKRRFKRNNFYHGMGGSVRYYSGPFPTKKLLFGEYLYYSGVVPWNSLIKAIIWQRKQRACFGNVARLWKYISDEELEKIIHAKKLSEPIGKAAVRLNLLTDFQVGAILWYQRFNQRPIGRFFVENGFLTELRLNSAYEVFLRHNSKFR